MQTLRAHGVSTAVAPQYGSSSRSVAPRRRRCTNDSGFGYPVNLEATTTDERSSGKARTDKKHRRGQRVGDRDESVAGAHPVGHTGGGRSQARATSSTTDGACDFVTAATTTAEAAAAAAATSGTRCGAAGTTLPRATGRPRRPAEVGLTGRVGLPAEPALARTRDCVAAVAAASRAAVAGPAVPTGATATPGDDDSVREARTALADIRGAATTTPNRIPAGVGGGAGGAAAVETAWRGAADDDAGGGGLTADVDLEHFTRGHRDRRLGLAAQPTDGEANYRQAALSAQRVDRDLGDAPGTVKLSAAFMNENVQVTVVVPVHDGAAPPLGAVATNPADANASAPRPPTIQRSERLKDPPPPRSGHPPERYRAETLATLQRPSVQPITRALSVDHAPCPVAVAD